MTIKQKWESHKTVEAFKIDSIVQYGLAMLGTGTALQGTDGQSETVDAAWITKHLPEGALHPAALVGGYFVRYKDGYTSWSPASAFEEGYTELKHDNAS